MTEGNSELLEGVQAQVTALPPQLLRYGVALLSVVLALATNLLLHSYLEPTPTSVFFAAVMVSAWYGGLGPGLLATLLSTLAVNYFYIEPFYSFNLNNAAYIVQLSIFVLAALLINSLNQAQRSAKRKAESSLQALQESEVRFSRLAQSGIIGTIVADLNGAIIDANDAFLQMVGYTREDLCSGRIRWQEMTPPEYLDVSERSQAELRLNGVCTPFEKEYIRKDGTRAPILLGSVMLGETTVIGFVLDITERKRAEEALRQSEERLRVALKNSPITVFNQDRELSYTWIYNPALGFDPREVIGKQDHQIMKEEDAAILTRIKRGVLETGLGVREEVKLTSQGQDFYYDLTIEPLPNVSGETIGITCAAVDITERKHMELALRQSETTLNALIASSPIGIALFDRDLRYIHANEALAATNGIPLQEHIGRTFWEVLPQWASVISPILQEVMATQEPLLNQEVVGVTHPSDQIRHGLVNYFPVSFPDGEVFGVGVTSVDISDRRRTEEALRQSEAQYRAIYDQVLVGIAQVDLSGKFLQINERFCEIVERSPADLLTLQMQDFTHPDDLPHNLVLFQQMLEDGSSFEIEKRYIRPNGSQVWVRNHVSLVRDVDGQPQFCVAVTEDITERKQAESALNEQRQLLETILKHTVNAIIVCDADGNLTFANPEARRLAQLDPQDTTLDLDLMDWGTSYDADGNVIPVEDYAISKALQGEISNVFETRMVRADGSYYDILVSAAPLLNDGKIVGAVADFVDISDRKRVEDDRKEAQDALRNSAEQLSLALTAAKLGDWSWDAATDIVSFSEPVAKMFGLPPGPYMTWTEMQSLLHPDDRDRARSQVEQAIAEHSDYDIEYRVVHADQTERWVAAKGRAQYDESGQVLGMLGVVQDITHRKQAEVEREQLLAREKAAREQAETANRIKDEFLAVLSHELRSPLNPILGWSKLLQTQKLDEHRTQQALATIERNAKLQTQLIEDLLDVSRILRGKLSLTITPIRLNNIIEAALETVRLAAEAKGIHLQKIFNLENDQVMGDAARLQQVVWNLLSNAVKFTPNGGRVEIRLESAGETRKAGADDLTTSSPSLTPHSALYAQLTVTDTGKGISPDFLPHVFDYFRQEDGTTTRKFGGLGLGLAIVRHITELHGGTVWAESSGEGLGATFTLQLPLIHTSVRVDVKDETPTPVNLPGLRVLAVDDDDDIRELIAFVLQQAEAEVRVVASAPEVLQQLKTFSPSILIFDVGMPEMDGYMLMRQVRSLPAEQGGTIPAIALTAYAGELNQQQAMAAGFQLHLAKPVEPDKLVEAIVTLLHQHQYQAGANRVDT
jgi:PAS domain S-box-containing protein